MLCRPSDSSVLVQTTIPPSRPPLRGLGGMRALRHRVAVSRVKRKSRIILTFVHAVDTPSCVRREVTGRLHASMGETVQRREWRVLIAVRLIDCEVAGLEGH